jgi:hypothetical protein
VERIAKRGRSTHGGSRFFDELNCECDVARLVVLPTYIRVLPSQGRVSINWILIKRREPLAYLHRRSILANHGHVVL